MNVCDRLAARFARLAESGLVDVRFTISGKPGLETAANEVEALYLAVENGHSEVLDFKDSHR